MIICAALSLFLIKSIIFTTLFYKFQLNINRYTDIQKLCHYRGAGISLRVYRDTIIEAIIVIATLV